MTAQLAELENSQEKIMTAYSTLTQISKRDPNQPEWALIFPIVQPGGYVDVEDESTAIKRSEAGTSLSLRFNQAQSNGFEGVITPEEEKSLVELFAMEMESWVRVHIALDVKLQTGHMPHFSQSKIPSDWGNSSLRLAFMWGIVRAMYSNSEARARLENYFTELQIDQRKLAMNTNYIKGNSDSQKMYGLSNAITQNILMTDDRIMSAIMG